MKLACCLAFWAIFKIWACLFGVDINSFDDKTLYGENCKAFFDVTALAIKLIGLAAKFLSIFCANQSSFCYFLLSDICFKLMATDKTPMTKGELS